MFHQDHGYTVIGTCRDTKDEAKLAHLTSHPAASARLTLVEADLDTPDSYDTAVLGCIAVFHTAAPIFFFGVTDGQKQLIDPAVNGTLNVLSSCEKSSSVKRVIYTSSLLTCQFPATFMPGNGKEWTEDDWSSEENPVLGMMPYIKGD